MATTELNDEIDKILEYIDSECIGILNNRHGLNYDEAREAIQRLIVEARIDELIQISRRFWQLPVPEQAILDRIKELIKLEEKPDKQSYMRGFHDGQDSLLDNGQIRLVPADEVLKAQLKLLDELQVNEWKDDHARLYMTRDAFYSLIEAKRKKVVGIKLV